MARTSRKVGKRRSLAKYILKTFSCPPHQRTCRTTINQDDTIQHLQFTLKTNKQTNKQTNKRLLTAADVTFKQHKTHPDA